MKGNNNTVPSEFTEIRGNKYLAADGFGKLLEYQSERIVLTGKRTKLTVKGLKLQMHYLSGERIGIDGIIRSVEYEPYNT